MHIRITCGLIYIYPDNMQANLYTCQPIWCQDPVLRASYHAESNYLVARGNVLIFCEYIRSRRVLNYHNSTPIRPNCLRGQTNITTPIFAPVEPMTHARCLPLLDSCTKAYQVSSMVGGISLYPQGVSYYRTHIQMSIRCFLLYEAHRDGYQLSPVPTSYVPQQDAYADVQTEANQGSPLYRPTTYPHISLNMHLNTSLAFLSPL